MDLLDRAENRRRHHPAARQHLRDPGVFGEAVVDRRPQHEHRALRVRRPRRVHEPGREAVDQHHQQLVLAAHVPIGRHRGDAELAREPAHRQCLDALAVEQADRRVEDGFAVDRRGATAWPGRHLRRRFGSAVERGTRAGVRRIRRLGTVSRALWRTLPTFDVRVYYSAMAHGTPTLASGKICYLEIPATDVERSSRFYHDAFGWELRTRGDGAIAFDDAVKEVSGSWVTGRPPSAEPGIMVHIMVADLDAALEAVRAAGGEVLDADAEPGERVGHVRDPAGNVIGVYQEPGLAARERTVSPVPEHLHTVTPRLALSDAAAGIEFYKAAFGAQELGERFHMPDGTLVHAELLIGDSVVMVKDAQDDEFHALLCTY